MRIGSVRERLLWRDNDWCVTYKSKKTLKNTEHGKQCQLSTVNLSANC